MDEVDHRWKMCEQVGVGRVILVKLVSLSDDRYGRLRRFFAEAENGRNAVCFEMRFDVMEFGNS